MSREVEVGIFELGYDNVRLFIMPGRSGNFSFTPDKQIPTIKLGGAYVKWQDFYAVALHEVMEFTLTREGHRYVGTQDLSCASEAYKFMFTHAQFSDCCAKAAEFLAISYKDLRLAWIRYKIEHHIKEDNYCSVP